MQTPDPSALLPALAWVSGAVALATCASLLGRGRRGRERIVAKRPLTSNEAEFFLRLRGALPNHVVLAQVSMGALLSSVAGRGRFDRKIVDFVVCAPSTMEVVVLVELDDKTHSAKSDRLRDAMTRSAGYATLRYASRSKPSPDRIAADVARVQGRRR